MKNAAILLALLALALPLLGSAPRGGAESREIISVTVGAGDQQAPIPVHLFYRTSLFETVFLSSEINAVGTITQLVFYNNFSDNLPNVPTRIWLLETPAEDLAVGWIPSTHMTQVFDGTVTYPSGQNSVAITLQAPFAYQGGNLAILVFKPWEDDYWTSSNLFQAQTVGDNRSLFCYNHNTVIDPASPPTTGVTGQFPKTTFVIDTAGTGSLSGTVRHGATPLEGALVQIGDGPVHRVTDAGGNYSFAYLNPGNLAVHASKLGYNPLSQNVTVSPGQASTLDFSLSALLEVFVQGRVVGSDAPAVGLANAQVSLGGYAAYEGATDAQGYFFFPAVYANQAYTYSISHPGYNVLTGEFTLASTDLDLGTLYLFQMAYPPANVTARVSDGGWLVDLAWEPPSIAEEGWLHYDSGENSSSFGTGGSLSFDVAARFPADSLAAYAGGSLRAIRYWPAMGGNFVVKVWTGGNASGPGTQVVNQPVIPVLNSWNTLLLDLPVPITGTEEIWIGYLCDVTGVNLAYAGFDAGPAIDGFGNLIHWQENWTTLSAVNPYCDFNWNLQGYAGLTAPTGETELVPLGGRTARSGLQEKPSAPPTAQRINAYRVWRLLHGQEANEAAWTSLTPSAQFETTFTDTGWMALPYGTYVWAVKTIMMGGAQSAPAFSNPLQKVVELGTVAGVVRNALNQPIAGATVTTGEASATTNAAGYYVLSIEPGTHSFVASAEGYLPSTQSGVVVVSGQAVTLNFQLQLDSPGVFSDGFESYADFAVSFAPWTLVDVDQSETYGMTGIAWEHNYDPLAYIIFNPAATIPPVTDFPAQSGSKFAACFSATIPPNNDWLISPLMYGGGYINFWARSYTADYGLERFKVGVSLGGTHPASFNIISGPTYVEAPTVWTHYSYFLSNDYNNQIIRVGIKCCSDDAFALGIDGFQHLGLVPVAGGEPVPPPETALLDNFPNPFNPQTTLRYSLREVGPVSLKIYNSRGQAVRTLVSETQPAGSHSVVWDGRDDQGRPAANGIYHCRMTAGTFSATRKLVLMK